MNIPMAAKVSPTRARQRRQPFFSNLRISTRQHLLTLISVMGLAVIGLYSGYTTRQQLLGERERALSQMMDAASNVANHFVKLSQDGTLPVDEAQREALAAIHDMRYGDGNYFWINQSIDQTRMRRLMNGANEKLVGTVADDDADVAFLKMVREHGGGTVHQMWPRPGTTEPVAKLSEVRGVDAWKWVIGSGVYIDDVDAAFWKQMGQLAIIFILTWVLISLGSLSITRSIKRPLQRAISITERIASGHFDTDIGQTTRDEIGQLLQHMVKMQERLKAVTDAQREMARQHAAGMISYRMDEAHFPGEFGDIVRETNAFVGSHVAMEKHLLEVMGHYAIGDFDIDLERYPGEKAALTETMDTVKRNLSKINGEIKRLAKAAAEGNFTERGDASQFQHDFAEMITELNTMMATSEDNLGRISELLRAIAEGNLTTRMHGEYQGVFARMRDDANSTVVHLTEIVGSIQHASTQITVAAGEIASGNSDLSQRTEQQAASLEETAASMEELTSTVRQNAEHARQANQLASEAASIAEQGGQASEGVAKTMSAIETSSHKIADIIQVIDGISFQTNILALNAAVEAARAGEQGRGFAVVASEVRTLAQRSANAAKEIKELIDDSVSKVADGSAQVQQATETMSRIVGSVRRVNDIMGEISAASQEQSSGIEQVNLTVTHMDETTQQNAALVEEAAAAARSMEEQAESLTEIVAQFRLAGKAGNAAQNPSRAESGELAQAS